MASCANTSSDLSRLNAIRDLPSAGTNGFGFPLLLGSGITFPEDFRSYSTQQQLDDDVTAGVIPQLIADHGTRFFQQTFHARSFYVWKRAADVSQESTVEVITDDDGNYSVTLNNGSELDTFNHAAASQTVTAIAAALAALIDADPKYNATSSVGVITIDIIESGATFSVSTTSPNSDMVVALSTAAVNVGTNLSNAKLELDDWFGFAMDSSVDLDNTRAAIWSDANDRFAALQTSTAAVADQTNTDNLATQLAALGLTEHFLLYRTNATSLAAWAWLVDRSATNFASTNAGWRWVNPKGEAADCLTPAQKTTLDSREVNYLIPAKDKKARFSRGRNLQGEPIDTIWTSAWLVAVVDTALWTAILQAVDTKVTIPFDNTGFATLEGIARAALLTLEGVHLQVGSSRVRFARLADLTDEQKSERCVTYTVGGLFSGATECTEGTAYLTLDENLLAALFPDE